jgi:hypothetical protein
MVPSAHLFRGLEVKTLGGVAPRRIGRILCSRRRGSSRPSRATLAKGAIGPGPGELKIRQCTTSPEATGTVEATDHESVTSSSANSSAWRFVRGDKVLVSRLRDHEKTLVEASGGLRFAPVVSKMAKKRLAGDLTMSCEDQRILLESIKLHVAS